MHPNLRFRLNACPFPGIHHLVLILLLACLLSGPVSAGSGGMITAVFSTEPGPEVLNASGYEEQARASEAARNWSGVIAITGEGLARFPDDPDLMCLNGYALRKTGRYQESVDMISRAIPLDPGPVLYANRAYGLLAMGRYQDALNDADAAIAINATYTTAYDARSLALLGLGNLTGAEQAIDTAISLDPAHAHAWQVKGTILSRSGNCTGAIQAYRRSIAIDPASDPAWPGMTNAMVELNQTEQRCAAAAARAAPATTKAGLPVVVAVSAVGMIAVWVRKNV